MQIDRAMTGQYLFATLNNETPIHFLTNMNSVENDVNTTSTEHFAKQPNPAGVAPATKPSDGDHTHPHTHAHTRFSQSNTKQRLKSKDAGARLFSRDSIEWHIDTFHMSYDTFV